MNQRPLDRKLLASFIEYAVKGVVTNIEWDRFIVTHYPDSVMEHARCECARMIIAARGASNLSTADRDYLYQLAKDLRSTA
jgi:hypothetical protein